jgi:copper(I)-binding protein
VNRALRAATVGVLLFTPVALSACSAGQVNQTSTQLRDKVGPTATVGDLELRGVQLAYPSDGSYSAGEAAKLQMAVVNNGSEEDVLTGISGTGFQRVRITGSPTGTVAPTSPSATSAAPTESSGGPRAVNIPVPPDSTLFLSQNGPTVTLVGLSQDLTPAQAIEVTFTFQRAGEVTVQVPVAAPSKEVARGSAFNFHEENQGNEPDTEAGTGGIPTQREGGNGG